MFRLFTSVCVIAPSPLSRRLKLINRACHPYEDLFPGFPIGIEVFALATIPFGAHLRRVDLLVRTNAPRDLTQVLVQLGSGGPPPVPVPVIDLVDFQARLQHEGVRYHRVVMGVGVLLDLKILLDDTLFVVEERQSAPTPSRKSAR
jgi:hypothetical protein